VYLEILDLSSRSMKITDVSGAQPLLSLQMIHQAIVVGAQAVLHPNMAQAYMPAPSHRPTSYPSQIFACIICRCRFSQVHRPLHSFASVTPSRPLFALDLHKSANRVNALKPCPSLALAFKAQPTRWTLYLPSVYRPFLMGKPVVIKLGRGGFTLTDNELGNAEQASVTALQSILSQMTPQMALRFNNIWQSAVCPRSRRARMQ
jgi:hypothetical protein